MTLPVFKRNPTCPKCGSDNVGFTFQTETKVPDEDHRPSTGCGWTSASHFAEHIHLQCARCGYGKGEPWLMAPSATERTIGFRATDLGLDARR